MGADRADLRQALFAVALHSRPDAGVATHELKARFPAAEQLELQDALHVLARSGRRIPRAVVHDSVRRLVARRPGVLNHPEVKAAHDRVLGAHALPDPLDAQTTMGNATWEQPVCTHADVTTATGQAAVSITLAFGTSRTVPQMAPYADPTNWPHCSAYFLAMDALSVTRSASGPTGNWAGAFEEVVEVVPSYPMTTPLRFTYRTDTTTNTVTSTYLLLEPTAYLDVDQGSIVIEPDTSGSGYQTRITAEKTIHWKDPFMQAWPSLACDTFWGELGLIMAAECGTGI